jgi:hypothetical protein
MLYLARGDIALLLELRSCNWIVAITGWMSNYPGDKKNYSHFCLFVDLGGTLTYFGNLKGNIDTIGSLEDALIIEL